MEKSKLIVNLSKLSSAEWRRFGDFVSSPFFNKHEETQLFFNYLDEHQGHWDQLNKAAVFAHIFPNEPYREQRVNNLMFNLMDLFTQYLGQVIYADKAERLLHIAEGMHSHNLWKLFKRYVDKQLRQTEQQSIQNLDYYSYITTLYRYKEWIAVDYDRRLETEAMQQTMINLEICFVIEKLKQGCEILNRMMVYDQQFNLGMIDPLLSYLKERWDYFGSIILVNLYHQMFMTLSNPHDTSQFHKLVHLIEENRGKCDLTDLKKMYTYSINIGIDLLNKLGDEFAETLFKVYLLLIEDGLHIRQGEISHMDYKNIVAVACKTGDYQWAEQFMYEHKEKLHVNVRKDTFEFNLACLYFNRQNYKEALLLLNSIKFNNTFYQINTKILQIKIFFELKEFDVLLSFLENFRPYLIRNRDLTTARINLTKKYVHFTKKFIKLLSAKNRLDIKDYRGKLLALQLELQQESTVLINKDWLLEHITLELS